MSSRVLRLGIAVLFLASVAVAQSQNTMTAPAKVRSLGVLSYRFTIDSGTISVALTGMNGTDMGQVTSKVLAPGIREIAVAIQPEERFVLQWNPLAKQLKLIESDGSSFSIYQDVLTGKIVEDEASSAKFDSHRAAIMIAAEAVSAAKRKLRLPVKSLCLVDCGPDPDPGEDLVLDPGSNVGGGGFSCGAYQVRGTASAITLDGIVRSDLCAAALNDANYQCSNRYCLGCCRTEPCDAMCFVGDYFCTIAGVTGYACGR